MSFGSVFNQAVDRLHIGIYFHGDEKEAEAFRHELSKRDDTSRVVMRAVKHYDGEVEKFDEVYVTPNARRFQPNEVELIVERYSKRKGTKIHLMDPPKPAAEPKKDPPKAEDAEAPKATGKKP